MTAETATFIFTGRYPKGYLPFLLLSYTIDMYINDRNRKYLENIPSIQHSDFRGFIASMNADEEIWHKHADGTKSVELKISNLNVVRFLINSYSYHY